MCGAGGPRLLLGFLGGGFGGNCGWARAPESGWAWCWRRGAEKEERSGGRCGGGAGRPKAAIFSWVGRALLGGNCGTAIGMGSGWTGDGLRCWSWRSRRREGSGGRCAGAECGAGRATVFSWVGVGALVGTWELRAGELESGWGAIGDRGWAWCRRRAGAGEKDVRVSAEAPCGGGGGRRPRFFLGWGLCGRG